MGALEPGTRPASTARIVLEGRDGTPVAAITARPDDGDPTGAVVVHPDVGGIRPLFDDLCRRLATHGYAVCCPEPFARAPAVVRDADAPDARLAFLPELDDDEQLADLAVAADSLGGDSVAVLGFCMGGMQTLKAAATGRFQRAVPFYGMIRLPDAWRGGHLRDALATATDVCPTLAIFGDEDPYTPAADIDALRRAWRDRPDCEIVVYANAEHGFVHVPDRPAHRANDAADAWDRALAFLAAPAPA
jgi:carboxymethylenebutenolidase